MTKAKAFGLLSAYTAAMKNEEEKRADLMLAMKFSDEVRQGLVDLIDKYVPAEVTL